MEATAPLTSWCDPLVIISAVSAGLYATFIGVVLYQTCQNRKNVNNQIQHNTENVNKQINSSNKFQWLMNFIELNSRLIRNFNDYENCKRDCHPYFRRDSEGNNEPIKDFQGKSFQERYTDLHNDLVEFDLMIKSYGLESELKVKNVFLETFISFLTARIRREATFVDLGNEYPERATINGELNNKNLNFLGDLRRENTENLFSDLNQSIEKISKEVSKDLYP